MEKDKLVEIKKGQTGTGLLIENDGYICPSKELVSEGNINGEWHCPNPFIVDAVFQKYGIKNANGRIYPESLLKREVEKYQTKIMEHRALGECYPSDSLILTENGWKTLEEVQEGENVLTLNVDTNIIEIQPVLRKVDMDWDDDIIHIHNRNINDVVTPNHEYILYNRYGKYSGRATATDILNKTIRDQNKKYIPRKGEWIGRNDEFFTIKNIDWELSTKVKSVKEKYSTDLVLPMKSFAKFMGIYLSEGYCEKHNGGSKVEIYQLKEETTNEIEEMLIELGLEFTKEKRKTENGYTNVFVICDMRLCKYLQQFGVCYDKFVPFELKQQNKEVLKLFYDWFVKGDGRIRGDKRTKVKLTDDVFSSSKRLALDLNEIQLKIGFCGSFHCEERNYDRLFGERLIEAKNSHPMYFSLRSAIKHGVTLDERFLKVEKKHYKGKVSCVEVANHNFYVMCNNKSHWTGNCNHPAESVIDLSRVSHNIIELHWEGHTLVGKMELNLTPGFIKHGIASSQGDVVANLLLNGYKVGVSSRGVGSVETRLGQQIVSEDFELICWDVVSEPSTPQAWISTSGPESMQTWIESDETRNSKEQVSEKINKLKKLLS